MNINLFLPSLSGGGAEKAAALFAHYLKKSRSTVNCQIFILRNEDVYSDKLDLDNIYILPRGILSKVKFVKNRVSERDINVIYLSTLRFYILLFLSNRLRNIFAFLQNPLREALALKKQLKSIQKLRLILICSIYKRHIQKVFAIAPGIKEELEELGVNNVVVIPNPIQSIPVEKEFKKTIQGEYLKIVSAGRLHPQKNFMRLLEATKYIKPDFRVSIFGEGPEEANLLSYIEEEKLTNKIDLRGFVKNLDAELRDADLFVLTSDYEGFGNVIIEALANGTKVISTNAKHGPPFILNDDAIGLLTEKNPKDIADKINWAHDTGWIYQGNDKCINRAEDFLISVIGENILKEIGIEGYPKSNV